MAKPKPSPPREIGIDDLAHARLASEEKGHIDDPDAPKNRSADIKLIKRRQSVFLILRESKSLTSAQSAAAANMMNLYSTMARVGQAPERKDIEDYFEREDMHIAQRRVLEAAGVLRAQERYRKICRKIGPTNAELLTLLFHDFMEGDHEPPTLNKQGKPIARWRVKVRAFFKARGRVLATPNEETLAVWIACDELQRAI